MAAAPNAQPIQVTVNAPITINSAAGNAADLEALMAEIEPRLAEAMRRAAEQIWNDRESDEVS